jgi:prophage antirepressor-like protein
MSYVNSICPAYEVKHQGTGTIMDEIGNSWWVAKDACKVLGIANPSQAVQQLDDDERSMENIGRQGKASIINM